MSPDDPRHGTYAGSQRHRKDSEKPCQPCLAAERSYMRDYRSRKMPGVVREAAAHRARSRALWRLADLHPAQFEALILDEYQAEGIA